MRIRIRKKHIAIVFGILFLGALFSVLHTFIFEKKALVFKEEKKCPPIVVQARNQNTGEIADFQTICEIPEGWDTLENGGGREINRNGVVSKTYWNANIGLSFEYVIRPDGYTLFETTQAGINGNILQLRLRNTKEYNEFKKSTFARESPAEIGVSVFQNKENIDLLSWIVANAYSVGYIQEKSELVKVLVGGVDGVTFLSDGLYMRRNYIVSSNSHIYVLFGPEDESFSDIKKDFGDLLKTFIFF